MPDNGLHPGDSHVQREAEAQIRHALEGKLGIGLSDDCGTGLRLDGFADTDPPVCVEIWAHQGPAKSAQQAKLMKDMCRMLLCERLLERPCRKILAVSDAAAVAFLKGSWQGKFAEAFGVEVQVVDVPEALRARIREAQKRQFR